MPRAKTSAQHFFVLAYSTERKLGKIAGPPNRHRHRNSAVESDPPALQLQELAFVDRNDNAVSGLLERRPARGYRIACGIAFDQGASASRLDGPQLVLSGVSLLDHSPSYGPVQDVRICTAEVLPVCAARLDLERHAIAAVQASALS